MKMKKIMAGILSVGVAVSITACGNSNITASSKNGIEGTKWVVSEKIMDERTHIFPTPVPNSCICDYDKCRIQFLSNGGIIVEAGNDGYDDIESNLCTYSQVDGKLEIVAPLGSKSYSDYEIKDDELTITDSDGNQVILTRAE